MALFPPGLFLGSGSSISTRKRPNNDDAACSTDSSSAIKRSRRPTVDETAPPLSLLATTSSNLNRSLSPPSPSSVGTSSPPPVSLEPLTTFESSSSSPTTSQSLPAQTAATLLPSSQLVTTLPKSNTNIQSTNNITYTSNDISHHPNEYYTAISAAKARLQTAQLLATQSQQNLSRAQLELSRSGQEVNNAMEYLKGVERRWGVIDVDILVGGCDDDYGRVSDSENSEMVDGSSSLLHQGFVSVDSQSTRGESIQRIQVSDAGESIVNGRYNLYLHPVVSNFNATSFSYSHSINNSQSQSHCEPATMSSFQTNHNQPKGPIYIHSEGPFSIQNEYYDVCLFQKAGYGDKLRWCIGLVPCFEDVTPRTISIESSDSNGNNGMQHDGDHDQQQSRRRNFTLAYIYYWMEMNANDATSAASPPLNNNNDGGGENNESSWGVCHGVRPVPMMEDVSGTTTSEKRWWQFWTA